ncbi:MAG: hypothetical protein [Microviridae sp.]|nr:MAG: hypothetical protein [Microviridae sp.]
MIKKLIEKIKKYFTVGEYVGDPFSSDYSSSDNEIIYGTPLWLTKGNEDGSLWYITFANYKLKEGKNKYELVKWFEDNKFNVQIDVMMIVIELNNQKSKA